MEPLLPRAEPNKLCGDIRQGENPTYGLPVKDAASLLQLVKRVVFCILNQFIGIGTTLVGYSLSTSVV